MVLKNPGVTTASFNNIMLSHEKNVQYKSTRQEIESMYKMNYGY